jgi:hypothetical protein
VVVEQHLRCVPDRVDVQRRGHPDTLEHNWPSEANNTGCRRLGHPLHPPGNTDVAVYAIAERAAALVGSPADAAGRPALPAVTRADMLII